ncbi:MAG TPA: hypothetical protein VM925_07050 [Labilithrix sp.]|jgi:hypothetical protein|nr:hypothetical protein [Labilithrix sp.]
MRLGAVAVVLGSILLAVPASARVDVPVESGRKVESAVFRADKSTGRAWVEVTLAKRFLSGKEVRQRGSAVAVRVPELSLDAATGRINVATADGRTVTCATLDESVQPTGACRIDASVGEVGVDTGFGVQKAERLSVGVSPK